jgi:hypothetical protein
VGAVLGYYPEDRVAVVLYTRPGFSQVTEGSRWVAGMFDGKIRLPIEGESSIPDGLGATVLHEYTHFVIHAVAPGCPAWLHEGIAQWKEGRKAASVGETLRRALENGKLVPIYELTRSFARTEDPEAVRVQYAQALSFTAFLVDRYGDYTLADLVRSVAKTGSVEKAIGEVYRTSPESLAEAWLDSLR